MVHEGRGRGFQESPGMKKKPVSVFTVCHPSLSLSRPPEPAPALALGGMPFPGLPGEGTEAEGDRAQDSLGEGAKPSARLQGGRRRKRTGLRGRWDLAIQQMAGRGASK